MSGKFFRIKNSAILVFSICLCMLLIAHSQIAAQEDQKPLVALEASPPDFSGLMEQPNPMRPVLERFFVDLSDVYRIYEIPSSPARYDRMKRLFTDWQAELAEVDFETLNQDGRIDYILFNNFLNYRLRRLEIDKISQDSIAPLLPFSGIIIELQETRRRMKPVDSAKAATVLNDLSEQIQAQHQKLADGMKTGETKVTEIGARLAARTVQSLTETLKSWFDFYNGYDPLFTWWADEPYKKADQALKDYASFLSNKLGGAEKRDEAAIVGTPIGRDALIAELKASMIPYTPEELIAIGKKEYAWCEAEMIRASRELGFGDEWLKAIEHVKTLHVEPGKQPDVIRDLALEAIEFLEERDLLTIPQLAKDTWRIEMMTPERQLITPFFTGGRTISVSFPTNTMAHKDKLMSMRGNNVHFSRATVQHELIPGHHLQGFMTSRYNTHRHLFRTPFWGEGWALHWEMLLWDLDFPQSPENRIGMLFWRIHRCARIIFSLSFHMGTMTPEECIDFLVNRVGHERANATAEVRRSFASFYGPLYQAAYMVGGLQFRALYKELVDSGKMTNREFHDIILKLNSMPVEMVRARLSNQKLTKDFKSGWKFYGEITEIER